MLNFKQIELLEILISIKKYQDNKRKVDGNDSNKIKVIVSEQKQIMRNPKLRESVAAE